MEENNNKQKNNFHDFMNFAKTPKGKALVFFGAYFIFFVVLAILAHSMGSGDVIGSNIKLNPYSYQVDSILKGNYHFSYQYLIDGVSTTYQGDANQGVSLFNDGVTNYYQKDDLFMKFQDGIWVKTENPYPLSMLLDISKLENVINQATYISKTELATGEKELTFQISTTTLVKLFENIDIDLDDPVNTIVLITDSSSEVVEIDYDVSSYAKYKGLATDQFQMKLSYSKFGEIEELEEPA